MLRSSQDKRLSEKTNTSSVAKQKWLTKKEVKRVYVSIHRNSKEFWSTFHVGKKIVGQDFRTLKIGARCKRHVSESCHLRVMGQCDRNRMHVQRLFH